MHLCASNSCVASLLCVTLPVGAHGAALDSPDWPDPCIGNVLHGRCGCSAVMHLSPSAWQIVHRHIHSLALPPGAFVLHLFALIRAPAFTIAFPDGGADPVEHALNAVEHFKAHARKCLPLASCNCSVRLCVLLPTPLIPQFTLYVLCVQALRAVQLAQQALKAAALAAGAAAFWQVRAPSCWSPCASSADRSSVVITSVTAVQGHDLAPFTMQ